MKTIFQALKDEMYYPVPDGTIENIVIRRGIDGGSEYDFETSNSPNYKGALADCLYSLIQAVSFAEGDKSVNTMTDKQRQQLLCYVNKLYAEIGEEQVSLEPEPKVTFM